MKLRGFGRWLVAITCVGLAVGMRYDAKTALIAVLGATAVWLAAKDVRA